MRSIRVALALSLLLIPAGVADGEEGKKRIPRLGDPGATEEVTGRIADSTRGRPGPVRLVLSLEGGRELAVLVVPDSSCDRLGLSLRTGEEITVIGQRMSGERPLLVAMAVVAEGKRIDLRSRKGGPVEAPGPGRAAGAQAETAGQNP